MYVITDNTPMISGKVIATTSSKVLTTQKAEFPKCDLEGILPTEVDTPWTKETLRPAMLEFTEELVWDALWTVSEHPPEVKVVNLRIELSAMGIKLNLMAGASVNELLTPSGLHTSIKRVSLAVMNQLAQQFDYKFEELK